MLSSNDVNVLVGQRYARVPSSFKSSCLHARVRVAPSPLDVWSFWLGSLQSHSNSQVNYTYTKCCNN